MLAVLGNLDNQKDIHNDNYFLTEELESVAFHSAQDIVSTDIPILITCEKAINDPEYGELGEKL